MLFLNFSTYFSPFSNYFISFYTRVFKIPYLYLDFYTRRFIYFIFPSLKPTPTPTILTLSKDIFGKAKTTFLNADERKNENKNANINAVFYNKKEYKQVIKEENNDLEKKWKSIILYKNTPRGNILMYYDAFKLGFVYTCDTSVSYDILNALAMGNAVVSWEYDVNKELLPKEYHNYLTGNGDIKILIKMILWMKY